MRQTASWWRRCKSFPAATGSRCWPRSRRRARPAASGRSASAAARSCSRPRTGRRRPLILNRVAVRRPVRSGQQAVRYRPGRHRQHGPRRRAVRQHRFLRRRSAGGGGIAGTRMSVAALKRLWPVFVAPKVRDWVRRPSQERHRGAPRCCGECAAEHAQGLRPAGARRRAVDRRAGDQLRDPAGAGLAGAARCRPQRAHRRPQCDGHARQRHRRSALRAQARR